MSTVSRGVRLVNHNNRSTRWPGQRCQPRRVGASGGLRVKFDPRPGPEGEGGPWRRAPPTRRCTNRRTAEQLATSPGSSISSVGIVIALTQRATTPQNRWIGTPRTPPRTSQPICRFTSVVIIRGWKRARPTLSPKRPGQGGTSPRARVGHRPRAPRRHLASAPRRCVRSKSPVSPQAARPRAVSARQGPSPRRRGARTPRWLHRVR
jgi:hypothetical protein